MIKQLLQFDAPPIQNSEETGWEIEGRGRWPTDIWNVRALCRLGDEQNGVTSKQKRKNELIRRISVRCFCPLFATGVWERPCLTLFFFLGGEGGESWPGRVLNHHFPSTVGRPWLEYFMMWPSSKDMINDMMISGWWFETSILFSQTYWVANHPNWLIFFRGVQTTNQRWY